MAIDVALLSPDNIMDICIEINKKAFKKGNALHILNKTDRFPHISLFQGIIDEKDLEKAKEILKNLSQKYNALKLKITKLNHYEKPNGKSWSEFIVDVDENYIKLRNELLDNIIPLHHKIKATQEMFFPEKNFNNISFNWVESYIDTIGYENHTPHITLNCSEAKYDGKLPIQFKASRLTIHQLGDHCTCRKILFETKLK